MENIRRDLLQTLLGVLIFFGGVQLLAEVPWGGTEVQSISTQSGGGAGCEEKLPKHTWDDLYKLRHWGIGVVFMEYAAKAGLSWDQQEFLASIPNKQLFAVGLVTGKNCLALDVAEDYRTLHSEFSQLLQKVEKREISFLDFQEAFLAKAEEYDFMEYIQYGLGI